MRRDMRGLILGCAISIVGIAERHMFGPIEGLLQLAVRGTQSYSSFLLGTGPLDEESEKEQNPYLHVISLVEFQNHWTHGCSILIFSG